MREQTPTRERYVAYKKIEKWLAQGYDAYEIALIWNQGSAGPCRSGVNKLGVAYNSCDYARRVVAYIN